jgi:hypothetical protein
MPSPARLAPATVSTRRGFFSVPARHAGHVVARVSASGSVWAWRAARKGERPSAACLFIPCRNPAHALAVAAVARSLRFRTDTRPGGACAVFRYGPLASSAPPLAVKVWLPPGVPVRSVRAELRAAWLNLVRP